jgi:hypothetical protein
MTVADQRHLPAGTSPGGDPLARAWTAVALIPVFFFIGFAAGELLYAVFGYKPENEDAPLWVDLVASLAALSVALVPCVGAVIYGRRASKGDGRRARVPLAIGAIAGAALVILTAVST